MTREQNSMIKFLNLRNTFSFSKLFILLIVLFQSFAFSWLLQYICFGSPHFLIPLAVATLLLMLISKRIFVTVNVITIIFSLLFPVSRTLHNGLLQWASVEVLLATDFRESSEFLSVLPLKNNLIALLFVAVNLLLLTQYKKIDLIKVKSEFFYILVAFAVVFTSYKAYPEVSSRVIEIADTYKEITTKVELKASDFGKVTKLDNKDRYKKIVVIIGESMRSDFMSTYGYKLKTMPLTDSLNKRVLRNFVAPAANTLYSVPRLLSIVNENGSYQAENNAIELAKHAGYQTWWITDHGRSVHNLSITELSKYADNSYFSPYLNDLLLLPKIENALSIDKDQVIFVHINGQHENPCSKLADLPIAYELNAGKTLNCYVSAYHVTDKFIYEVSKMLEKYSDNSYALLYFSDHGLNFDKDLNGFSLRRDGFVKHSYDVPLLEITSSTKGSTMIEASNSGFNMIHHFANLFGVRADKLIDNYDIFDKDNSIKPKVYFYSGMLPVDYDSLKDGNNADRISSLQ